MGVITLKLDDSIEERLRRKVGREQGAARGTLSAGVEQALKLWLGDETNNPETSQSRASSARSYIAKNAKSEKVIAEAPSLEILATRIRELGMDPRSVIIESVPPPARIVRMGLRTTKRRLTKK